MADLAFLFTGGLAVAAIFGVYHIARKFKKDGENLKDWG
jgi:hypothetical protein